MIIADIPADPSPTSEKRNLPRRLCAHLSATELIPAPFRAILGYYSSTGDFAPEAVLLKKRVDKYTQNTIRNAFKQIEREIADEINVSPSDVHFDYDTKLTMPAELTLGHIYQRTRTQTPKNFNPVTKKVKTPLAEYFRFPYDKDAERRRRKKLVQRSRSQLEEIEIAESVTDLVIIALLDGDMRDAINDKEYSDFQIDCPTKIEQAHAAKIAQRVLQNQVENLFSNFPSDVRDAYERAVTISEQHQERDDYFRDLMTKARSGDEEALRTIEKEYKSARFEDPPELFTEKELSYPYLKTQYGRVGAIYDGMIEMYRAAGIEIKTIFKRSIVFAIIGAQIWLDDVNDFQSDIQEAQLTPVTAEYLLNGSEFEAYQNIIRITNLYLNTAKHYAAATDSPLAGIGTDYIFRRGSPTNLPGHD